MDFWADFWNIIWWFLWAFVFISYLMALFAVISDIFRDDELNGWFKAIWLIFLLFVPFLTVLVYVIARGRGMNERSARMRRQAQLASEEYIRSVAGNSPTAEIEHGKALLDSGAITEAEFARLKEKALA